MSSIYDNLSALISVDIEAAGPIPSQYALLSIGACTLTHPRRTFYVELIPDKDKSEPGAERVHRLDMDVLRREGTATRGSDAEVCQLAGGGCTRWTDPDYAGL
jgi:hypothetical protein